jgi:type IV secretion system protein VirD4
VIYKARAGAEHRPTSPWPCRTPRNRSRRCTPKCSKTRGAGRRFHPIIAALRAHINRPDEERGSVLSTAMSFLSIYRDPLIARTCRTSSSMISRTAKPVTVPSRAREDKDRLKPLMQLIINQLMRVL